VSEASSGPSVRQRWLGERLMEMRLAAGHSSLSSAAKVLRRSAPSISRLENGQVVLPVRDFPPILDAYGVTDTQTRERILAVASEIQQERRGWWVEYADGAPWQRWHLRQRYQYVEGEVHSSEGCARLRAGRLRGAAMEFVLGRLGGGRRHYRGQVAGDSMRGICVMPDGSCRAWSAARVAR